MKLYYYVPLLAVMIFFSGCSTRKATTASKPVSISKTASIDLNDLALVKQRLYSQYRDWKGVDYRMGGLSKKGVDCSGFTYTTFRSKFGVELPRTTTDQAKVGVPVQQSELKAGDLVFFKTGWSVRHVGIYLEKRQFLHASTSKGVMISSLDNVYWRSKYWQAKRIR